MSKVGDQERACNAPNDDVRTVPRPAGEPYVQPWQTATKRFEVRLSEREREAWKAIASARGMNLADMVRAAVIAFATPQEAAPLMPPDVEAVAAELRSVLGGDAPEAP